LPSNITIHNLIETSDVSARDSEHGAQTGASALMKGVRMTSLTDDAIDQIKRMIVAGRLRPGDRLPREQDLAELLGLSRGTLREAVRALTAMKVVDVRRGDGAYVTSLAPELMLEALNLVVDLHRGDTVLHFLGSAASSNPSRPRVRLCTPTRISFAHWPNSLPRPISCHATRWSTTSV